MRALTVQQPWAWAIIHGGKDIENRTQAWSYRGPLAIHTSRQESAEGYADCRAITGNAPGPSQIVLGALIGVVDLIDAHVSTGLEDDPWSWCCRPWPRWYGHRSSAHSCR